MRQRLRSKLGRQKTEVSLSERVLFTGFGLRVCPLLPLRDSGNALMDRLAAMADSGKLKRDPKWSPVPAIVTRSGSWKTFGEVPQSVRDDAYVEFHRANPGVSARGTVVDGQLVVSAERSEIRNPLAYEAAAKGNQQRVSNTLKSVQNDPFLDADTREIIASAITGIGNTSSREKAQALATDAIDRLNDDHRGYARSILKPLLEQIKH